MKQIITMQQIYEVNLEYRIDTAKSFQTTGTLNRFNLSHNLSLTIQQIMGYALSPYLVFSLELHQLNLLHRFFSSEPTPPISTSSQHTSTGSPLSNSPHRDLSQSFAHSTHSPYGQSSKSQIFESYQFDDSFPCGQFTQAQSPSLSILTQLSPPYLTQQQTSRHLLPKQKLDQLRISKTSKESTSSISFSTNTFKESASSISSPTYTFKESASSISYNPSFIDTSFLQRHIPRPPPPPPRPQPQLPVQQYMAPPQCKPLPLSIPPGFNIPKQATHFHNHHIVPSISQIENTQYLTSISLQSQHQQQPKRQKKHHQQS
jgi:hypothetical protein